MEQHGNLYLTIGSALGSAISFAIGHVTGNTIGWVFGVAAACVSIVAGLYTIKEKRMSIRQMKKHNRF